MAQLGLIRILVVFFGFSAALLAETPTHEEWLLRQGRARDDLLCDADQSQTLLKLYRVLKEAETPDREKLAQAKKLADSIGPGCFNDGTWAELTAFFAWHGLLPCDPKDLNGRANLKLVGEAHHHPQFNDAIQNFTKRANAGDIVFGIERIRPRLQASNARKNTHNIDPDIAYSLTTLLNFWRSLHLPEAAKDYEETSTAEALGRAVDQTVWEKMGRPLESRGAERLAKLVDFQLGLANVKPGSDALVPVVANAEVRQLVDAFLSKAFTSLDPVKHAHALLQPDIEMMKRYYRTPLNREVQEKFTDTVTVKWRDRLMAAHALSLVCQAKGRDVVLQVGAAHVAGIYRLVTDALIGNGVKPGMEVYTDVLDVKFETPVDEATERSIKGLAQFVAGLPKTELKKLP